MTVAPARDELQTARPESGPVATARTVLHVMPDLAIGGGQTIVLQGVRHHTEGRYRVLVAVLSDRPDDMVPAFEAAGAQVLVVPPGSRVQRIRALTRLMRARSVDLVQTHNDADRRLAQPAALLARVPVVGHLHAEWVHLGNLAPATAPRLARARSAVAGALRDLVERRTVRAYVAESAGVERIFAPLVHAPMTVLRQAVPVDRFEAARASGARARVRQELGLPSDATVMVTVSRLVPGKGHHDLPGVLAAARSGGRDVRLLLVGDGELRPRLEAEFASAGLTDAVVLAGNRSDVPDVLAASDLFLFPSYSEGFGMVALEAMASGLPVVAYDLPPFHEFLDPGRTALLAPLGDAEALARSVCELLEDPARRAAMGADGAAQAAERFPADGVARVFEQVYDEVLAGSVPSPTRRTD